VALFGDPSREILSCLFRQLRRSDAAKLESERARLGAQRR
jgi:hypothetical protein